MHQMVHVATALFPKLQLHITNNKLILAAYAILECRRMLTGSWAPGIYTVRIQRWTTR